MLVVEDDSRQLESITRLLEHESVRIVGVRSAAEALAKLQQSTFEKCASTIDGVDSVIGNKSQRTVLQRRRFQIAVGMGGCHRVRASKRNPLWRLSPQRSS